MERDRLVVAIDHPDVGVRVNWTYVNLKEDDLVDKALEIVAGVWGWSPEMVQQYDNDIEYFVIDPDHWKNVCKRIKWPTADSFAKGPDSPRPHVEEAIERCKLRVYRACKIHWSHDRIMRYASRSEAHREEALAVSG
jgi:hypothetical protein